MLLQIQQQYQAAGKLISVLSDLTDTILSIVR
jgi:flagellar hook-associated protein FlgK